ncbi:M1 family metallopeptidase [Methanocalculus taiwanensis]|uniref:M1 family metallopeptidase n=1 Tax=Methanocalculus taiwanensis TaxID=106207 RepID=A0ABD4TGR2_9EURY|nr:M1 family metallopeptidase [Methanocalculus taiwanensis]MCQ1537921.1 M1 family metallopeptidase [Methanocalculus taiwanensis]
MPPRFRYYRSDFSPSPVDVIHMDLTFAISDTETRVLAETLFRTQSTPIRSLYLNAKDLEIHSISCRGRWCEYTQEEDTLRISFGDDIPPQTEFIIQSETICRPSHTLLEGLYYDETPEGSPPTQITQCQQWGFERLVPCIDEMTAKCTYRTTIIADSAYTHMISNGDIATPRHRLTKGHPLSQTSRFLHQHPASFERDLITYENITTPMAPYLFFLGVGTYASFRRTFEYPSGRTFLLELLCPPGSDPIRAEQALDILEDGILWVYLFTGPHCYEQVEVRHEIYRLYNKRAKLRKRGADAADLLRITRQMELLDKEIVGGYIYTGSVYREIGMQNSDFGGMENVGNTTISTNRLMPFAGMTDAGFEYLMRVKLHEYYHNLNGSEVTGETPFEIWLNEAVTVHVEQQYHAFHFGEDYSRLQTILSLLDPADGTFARDTGAAAMPIEPDGFNDPNDLITSVTYVKAPEFVRMVEKILGKEPFVWALSLYHRKFAHSNASRDDWVHLMGSVAGVDLGPMAEGWLKRPGFPTITVNPYYNPEERLCTVHLLQSGGNPPWIFPFDLALMKEDGTEIASRCHLVQQAEEQIIFEDVDCPAYYSLNRGFSCYGLLNYHPGEDLLYLQARTDPDIAGRYLAFHSIASMELNRLMKNPDAGPSGAFITLFIDLLSDPELMEGAGAQVLTLFEDAGDPAVAHHYRAAYEARRRMELAIATSQAPTLQALYKAYHQTDHTWESIGGLAVFVRNRQVKNLCLRLLARLDTPDIHEMIKNQYLNTSIATDRMHAFSLLIASSDSDRLELFRDMMNWARKDPVVWEQFLAATASSDAEDLVSLLREIESSGYLRIEQANDQRALFGRFARNRKKSLETEDGRSFFEDALFRLMDVNEYTTTGLLIAFSHVDRMDPATHIPLMGILINLLRKASSAAIQLTLKRIVLGNPVALRTYESAKGHIPELE